MNDTIKSIFERKSIRSYQNKTISDIDKQLIIESALQAPTAGNQILYSIIDIDDQEIKNKLSILCDNQPFIATAPMVLIFVADTERWTDSYKYAKADYRNPGYGDILLASIDATIAAQNTVVAAQSLNIGSCYIGDILENKEKVVELLNLEKYQIPVTMVVYGYATEQQISREKPMRFNKRYIVHKNKYKKLTEMEIREMHEEVNTRKNYNFEEYIKAFCKRKYMSEFALEFVRSVREYFKDFE